VAFVETIVSLGQYRISGVEASLHEREFFPGEADPGARLILGKN
jgi:hypothetical protein